MEFGTSPGLYTGNTQVQTVGASGLTVLEVTSLQANTRYVYRARYRTPSEAAFRVEPERSFYTQRAAGSTFTFAVQGDSHPERANQMFNAALYTTNLRNAAGERPDFYIGLGDDFSVEHLLDTNTQSQDAINQLYATQRGWLGLIGQYAPLFLVNGKDRKSTRLNSSH